MDTEQVKQRSRSQKHSKTKKNTSSKGKETRRKKSKAGFGFLIIAFVLISFMIGAMVGYGVIIEKRPPLEVFNLDTWTHMYDLIFG